jgi:hypothetical protein
VDLLVMIGMEVVLFVILAAGFWNVHRRRAKMTLEQRRNAELIPWWRDRIR